MGQRGKAESLTQPYCQDKCVMENVSESSQESLQGIGEIRLIRLHQKGAEAAVRAFRTSQQMDINPPGSKMAPKAHIIICYVERGKPYAFLCRNVEVSTPQGKEKAQRVEERDKKRTLAL